MASFGAVLDTCVLYPMPLADTLLLAAADGAYTFHWSDDLLDELRDVMVRRGRTSKEAARRDAKMRETFAESQVTGYRRLIQALELPDPDDRHVLAAAIRVKAERIVTYDSHHFPEEVLAEYDIKAYHPDQFLLDLVDLFPASVLPLLRRQVARMKRHPMTLDELLVRLERNNHLPKFVAQVRQYLLVEQQENVPFMPEPADAVLDFSARRTRGSRRRTPRA